MQEKLQHLAEIWIGYKTQLIGFVGLTNDAMHVHASLLILLLSAAVLRRRPDSIWCWLIVFIAELFNEYADLKGLAPGEASIRASIHDLYNTMFWPTIMLILGRFIFPPNAKEPVPPADESGDFANESLEEPAPV
jgi:di/tricarboxylate transporter